MIDEIERVTKCQLTQFICSKTLLITSQTYSEMASSASFVTIDPLFEVQEGKIDEFIAAFQPFASTIATEEPKNFNYDFTVCGNMVHCREFYADADGVLAHMARVGGALAQVRMSLH